MNEYAAFLRGVNVGGRIVKMADVKTCLEGIGLTKVSTLLQSGNVLFESELGASELKLTIEEALIKTFGYPVKVQILTTEKLCKVITDYPFGTAGNDQHDYVIFLENSLEKDLADEPCELSAGEKVKAGKGVVYWRVDKGSTLKSSFAKLLTKSKYKNCNTNRNLKTLKKMLVL